MYWLCYHIHTYKKTQVALVHGISMGGGRSLMVPMKFSVLTEKTLREFLALTGARLNGKELVAAGQATHFFPLEKISDLEKRLISLNSGNENAVKAVIEEFSVAVKPDEESVLNKKSVIDGCFSKDTVAEIIQSLEAEANKEGNGWIGPVLKGLKRSSPTGLRITLRSWNPLSLDNVGDEKVDLVFQPFAEDLELEIKEGKANRWDGKYENAAYASFKVTEKQDTFLVRVQG
ncbi:3-hydroxyisobutyryl-CoA hydrolase-like protein 5 isoform X2 [Pyrus x bretschneideri]|uniref:3-hydroxyisobutyryl-CoA hydrolase-like protein 5 isoform X2 n=1 Tax=Pyrus x bretschneideri TaxID=225117 RepID=UPI00202ECA1E|nr:3-hydroxyisobutyryl-CoA hydrolase-like protein 5 isoform X2 [Pyrus x bretschneideri]